MSDGDRVLFERMIGQIAELTGEMREFKTSVADRLTTLETRCEERQKTPGCCSIGRSLKEHVKTHDKGKTQGWMVIGLIVQGAMLMAMVVLGIFF